MKTRKAHPAPLRKRSPALPGWMTGANPGVHGRQASPRLRESADDLFDDSPDPEYATDRWLIDRPGRIPQSDEYDS